MVLRPTKLDVTEDRALVIEWSDGRRRRYTFRELREGCRCATCREKRAQAAEPATALPILSPAETQPIQILGMKPVGNYAYSIAFSDGHNTGIYTFEHLGEMGEEAP